MLKEKSYHTSHYHINRHADNPYGDRIFPDHSICNLQLYDADLSVIVLLTILFRKQHSDETARASSWLFESKCGKWQNIQKTFCRWQPWLTACFLAAQIPTRSTSIDLQTVEFGFNWTTSITSTALGKHRDKEAPFNPIF
jgi:hypothetical protein